MSQRAKKSKIYEEGNIVFVIINSQSRKVVHIEMDNTKATS